MKESIIMEEMRVKAKIEAGKISMEKLKSQEGQTQEAKMKMVMTVKRIWNIRNHEQTQLYQQQN